MCWINFLRKTKLSCAVHCPDCSSIYTVSQFSRPVGYWTTLSARPRPDKTVALRPCQSTLFVTSICISEKSATTHLQDWRTTNWAHCTFIASRKQKASRSAIVKKTLVSTKELSKNIAKLRNNSRNYLRSKPSSFSRSCGGVPES